MKNKTISFRKWLSTGHLDTHLAKSMGRAHLGHVKGGNIQEYTGNQKSAKVGYPSARERGRGDGRWLWIILKSVCLEVQLFVHLFPYFENPV